MNQPSGRKSNQFQSRVFIHREKNIIYEYIQNAYFSIVIEKQAYVYIYICIYIHIYIYRDYKNINLA